MSDEIERHAITIRPAENLRAADLTVTFDGLEHAVAWAAALWEAAPEMLAALEQAERVLCGWEHVEDSPEEQAALAAVRAAIAKAQPT